MPKRLAPPKKPAAAAPVRRPAPPSSPVPEPQASATSQLTLQTFDQWVPNSLPIFTGLFGTADQDEIADRLFRERHDELLNIVCCLIKVHDIEPAAIVAMAKRPLPYIFDVLNQQRAPEPQPAPQQRQYQPREHPQRAERPAGFIPQRQRNTLARHRHGYLEPGTEPLERIDDSPAPLIQDRSRFIRHPEDPDGDGGLDH